MAEWLAITTKAVLAAANYIITPGMQFNYITAKALGPDLVPAAQVWSRAGPPLEKNT